jgi:uncharacterized membrane-anchored protein YjiN (DUF445 family)
MYDKKSKIFSKAAIEKVAQQAKFYDEATEKQLNESVERPGNRVFDKLISGQRINAQERIHAAVYIATMYSRVPRRRTEITKMVPSVAEKVLRELFDTINDWIKTNPEPRLVERRLKEMEEVSRKVRTDPIKGAVVDLIRSPWASQRIIGTIASMCWRIGRVSAPHFFITSDNPVHFFKGLGLANARSELAFPISADLALYASWRGQIGATLAFHAPASLVKECNRRVAFEATRFVFTPKRESWIGAIANKERPFFSEIRW